VRRDLFGERPLYYVEAAGGVRTATSVWKLARDAGIAAVLDPVSLAAALCGTLPRGRSLFRGIGLVPPAHALLAGPDGVTTAPYWEPPLAPREEDTTAADAARDELLRRLRLAVEKLRPRPRAVCALSGGLDSAALLALLAEGGAAVRAWSLADDFAEDGELDHARDLARSLGAEHRLAEVAEDELPERTPDAVCACEALLWNGRAVARHRFYQAIGAGGDTAVVSGVGADEVLLGHPAGLRGFEERAEAERALVIALVHPAAAARLPERPAFAAPAGVDPLVWRQHVVIRDVLPDSTLPPECRAAAAEGVEVRLPYLDREVAEHCLRLPLRLRVRGETGKVLLREAMRGRLPEEIRTAPKRARLAPGGGRGARARERWLAFYGHWLSPARVRDLGVVEPARVTALLDRHRGGDSSEQAHAVRDAVLMRLASAAVLQERGARETTLRAGSR
jgi:asparagine synthase (glutamine-hydrolysing)